MANSNAQQNHNVGRYDSAKAIPRSKQVRRINDDWAYLNPKEAPRYATNDDNFNAQYPKKGLQPHSLDQIDKKEPPANDDSYQQTESDSQTNQTNLLSRLSKRMLADKALSVTKNTALRARVSTVNSSIFAWAGSLWFTTQLPFALLSIALLGLVGSVKGVVDELGIVGSAISWLASSVTYVVGVDLSAIVDGLFIIPYVIVVAIGIITLMAIYLQYTLSLMSPLSGEQAGLKLGIFLLAIIGYSLPLLNIFPWALVFMAVVWKYPR